MVEKITADAAESASTVRALLDLLEHSAAGDEAFADDLEKAQREQPELARSPRAS